MRPNDPAPNETRQTGPIQRVRNEVAARVKHVEDLARQSDRKRARASLYVWRLVIQVFSQWRKDRCPQQAASLSFQAVLSVVPALALAMASFRATGMMEAESSLIRFLASEYLPLSAEEISQRLLRFSENITFESLGLVGLPATLLIAFWTFNSLEQSINAIWRVEKRRSLPRRLAAFYLTAIIGATLVGLSLYQAAQFGIAEGWSGAILSGIIAFTAIFLGNFFLPATRVRVGAALVGAAVTTLASEVAKMAFATYVARFALAKYSDIYGQLAAIPLCLVWIYWSWLMLFLGVEVTHSVQNLRLLEGRTRRVQLDLAGELDRVLNGRTAARLLAAIASAQATGGDGLSRFQLAERFTLSSDAIRIMTNRLADAGYLQRPTHNELWSLAKAPADINVLELFDAFRYAGDEETLFFEPNEDGRNESIADRRLAELVGQSRKAAANCTIDTLLDP